MVTHLENWSLVKVQGFLIFFFFATENVGCKDGVFFLYDDGRPNAAHRTRYLVQKFGRNHSRCNSDLAPSDFYLFPPLKGHLSGQHFTCDEDYKNATISWLTQQELAFCASVMERLTARCDNA
jgi:hypothetical protein